MSEDKDKIDLFKEAADESLDELINRSKKTEELPVSKEEEHKWMEEAGELVLNTGEEWDELALAMHGKFAKKAMNIMTTLPDREFMRIYPKMLEYFKPKMTRTEGGEDGTVDNTVVVQIVQRSENGEINIITLNEKNNG